jgi:anthranilate phosphoribosyltransferase
VLLNAAAAFIAAGRVATLEAGIDLAAGTIGAGSATELLRALRAEKQDRAGQGLTGATA